MQLSNNVVFQIGVGAMKTFVNCEKKITEIGVGIAISFKKIVMSLKRSKELENNYFKMQRIGNVVRVESKGIGGGFGEIYIDKTYLRKTFRVIRNEESDENIFCGISAPTLRSVRIGQRLTAILRRRDTQLRMEMIQGGRGSIGLGRKESEDAQRNALMSLEIAALQLFNAEELKVSVIDTSSLTPWMLEHPYGYVHK